MKKLIISAITAILTFICSSAVYAKDANVVVNGKEIDTEAVISENRVLVPIRGVYEQLGFDVKWYPEEKDAEFTKGSHYMLLYSNGELIDVDGRQIRPDVKYGIINDRMYLPLRVTGEAFGLEVSWDAETKTAYIDGTVDDGGEEVDFSDNTGFAFKMNSLMPKNENYMFSPLSIKMALALAANGADGDTQKEITKALDIDDIEEFNAYAKQLIQNYSNNKNVELAIANSLWLNTQKAPDTEFNADYCKKMLDNYNAAVEKVDYSDAVLRVNSWCSENTKGKIPSIIESPDFAAILANAIYFKGDWAEPFNKDATYKQFFTDRNGKKTETDFMHMEETFEFFEDDDVKILKMPYKGGNTSMYFILSGDKRIDINDYTDKMTYEDVVISIPKFKTEYKRTLNSDLRTIGIDKAFDALSADFKPMFYSEFDFYIDKVLHKTYIDVDETGTEAAAVTAIVMETAAAVDPSIKKEFIADEPFGYAIIDNDTGEILFMGEYAFVS